MSWVETANLYIIFASWCSQAHKIVLVEGIYSLARFAILYNNTTAVIILSVNFSGVVWIGAQFCGRRCIQLDVFGKFTTLLSFKSRILPAFVRLLKLGHSNLRGLNFNVGHKIVLFRETKLATLWAHANSLSIPITTDTSTRYSLNMTFTLNVVH